MCVYIYIHNLGIANLKTSRVLAGPAAMKPAAQQCRRTAGQAHSRWEGLAKMWALSIKSRFNHEKWGFTLKNDGLTMKNPDFTAKNDGSTMKKTGLYNHENGGLTNEKRWFDQWMMGGSPMNLIFWGVHGSLPINWDINGEMGYLQILGTLWDLGIPWLGNHHRSTTLVPQCRLRDSRGIFWYQWIGLGESLQETLVFAANLFGGSW